MKIAKKILLRRSLSISLVCVSACLAFFTTNLGLELSSVLGLTVSLVVLITSYNQWGALSGITMFQFFLAVFHLGLVVPIYVFGTTPPAYTALPLGSSDIPISISLYIFSAGSLLAGAMWVTPTKGQTQLRIQVVEARYTSALFWAVFLAFASIYLAYGFYSGILTAGNRSYLLELRGGGGGQLFGISRTFMVTGMMGLVVFADRKQAYLAITLGVLFLLPLFVYGQRGYFLTTVAAMLLALNFRGIKIRLPYLVGMTFMVMGLIPILRRMRGGIDSFASGFLDPLYEMGQSLMAVIFTVENIRFGVWEHMWGWTYLSAFYRVIPNVMGLRDMLGAMEDAPATVLRATNNPQGSGLGFSSVAEAYWNFGFFGPLMYFFLLGFFIVRTESVSFRSPYILVVYANLMAAVFWTSRSDFNSVARPLVWGWLLVFLVMIVARWAQRLNRSSASL